MPTAEPRPGSLIGAVDAGSNAIRFGIYKLDTSLYPMRVYQKRYPVRLGAGTFSTGAMTATDMDAAVEAFREIASTAAGKKVNALPAVATSAIREASNCHLFLARVESETGIMLCAITGSEEARLAALGAAPPVDGANDRLLIDVGGGSTEVSFVKPDGHMEWNVSLRLGAVRLARQWEAQGSETGDSATGIRMQEILDLVREHIEPRKADAKRELSAIAIGGTANALYQACRHLGLVRDDNMLTLQDVMAIITKLGATAVEDYPARLNVNRDRAGIVLPGAMVLGAILQCMGVAEARISDAGVREGLVQDYLVNYRS